MNAQRSPFHDGSGADWRPWRDVFARRSRRPLPKLDVRTDYSSLPKTLAESLAIFQLGESGGGTIVTQARQSTLAGAGAAYADTVALFVAEEHRHANILAMCVRMLGGELLRRQWTARLFVFARRLMGLRLKVLVLLTAEIVGICYYHLIASRLPTSPLRSWLLQIVSDERSHLEFHCEFLRSQVVAAWHRWLFVAAWRCLSSAAALVVLCDHRRALRDLGIDAATIRQRWVAYARLAEQLVVDATGPRPRSRATASAAG